jgi:ABC-2 type transport system permease protein
MQQVLVIFHLQWLLFKNALRSRANVAELVARAIFGAAFIVFDLVLSAGMAVFAYMIPMTPLAVPILSCVLAGFCIAWQSAPLLAASFGGGLDIARLRLYPVSNRKLFALDLSAGFFDPVALLAYPPLAAMFAGIALSVPSSAPTAAAGLAAFVVFNVALARYLQRLLERLLTSRRRKELLLVLVCVIAFLPQALVGLSVGGRDGDDVEFAEEPGAQLESLARRAVSLAEYLAWTPPGLAARAAVGEPDESARDRVAPTLGVLLFAAAALLLNYRRLEKDFRGGRSRRGGALRRASAPGAATSARPVPAAGGNRTAAPLVVGPHEALAPDRVKTTPRARGWLTPACAAVARKEIRYLYRTPRALVTLVAPVLVSLLFMGGTMRLVAGHALAQYALPGLSFYALLVTSQLFTNAFGFDAHGAKLYFVAPVRGRDVLLGKNLALGGVAACVIVVVAISFHVFFLPLTLQTLVDTIFVTAITLFLMLGTGNFLSILYPQPTSASKLAGSANGMQIVLSLVWVVLIFAVIGLGPLAGWLTRSSALAYTVLGLELVASIALYVLLLDRASRLFERRAERFLHTLLAKP